MSAPSQAQAAPFNSRPASRQPDGLASRDWLVSLGLHAGVAAVLLWAISGAPAPETKRAPVVLDWHVAVPQPHSTAVAPPKPVQTASPAAPKAASAAASPAARQPVQASAPPAGKELYSAPAVTIPVAAAETLAKSQGSAVSTPPAPAATHAPPGEEASTAHASTPPAAGTRPPATDDADADYQRWRHQLMQSLHAYKRFPAAARRMGQAGTVLMHIRFSATGELLHWTLLESSGFKVLDQAAEQLVHSVLKAMKAQHQPGRQAELRIPVVYELTD